MPAIYHILNGDALLASFPSTIAGPRIIARECLIEGSLVGETISDFWKTRAAFIEAYFGESQANYHLKVVTEFQKMIELPEEATINLWFEDDLFCLVNCWFCLSLLKSSHTVYLVKPNVEQGWLGFGQMSPSDLEKAFKKRILLTPTEKMQLLSCWQAYRTNDFAQLRKVAATPNRCFPKLQAVCQAHLDRFPATDTLSRPLQILQDILNEQTDKSFRTVFPIFSKQAGIYGFGDLQVKHMYHQLLPEIEV
ncbi:MAG: DUF1835 domain-containing protein [Saprospiraceae bacterium]